MGRGRFYSVGPTSIIDYPYCYFVFFLLQSLEPDSNGLKPVNRKGRLSPPIRGGGPERRSKDVHDEARKAAETARQGYAEALAASEHADAAMNQGEQDLEQAEKEEKSTSVVTRQSSPLQHPTPVLARWAMGGYCESGLLSDTYFNLTRMFKLPSHPASVVARARERVLAPPLHANRAQYETMVAVSCGMKHNNQLFRAPRASVSRR